jgi:glyoxylase-like metal-dependent hydrolase (beta-lactamase superfamily II)
MSSSLEYQVFTATRPGLTPGVPPGHEELMWVANSATLISGERDAVLVDTFLTIEHGEKLADEVAAAGKNLTYTYVTHGHGDHFFGINVLKRRFPGVKAVSTRAVVARMATQLEPEMMDGVFRRGFPGQIPDDPGTAEHLDREALELEGHPLVPIATGHTDTADTTSLHVPSIGLIAAGDVVYNHAVGSSQRRQARGRQRLAELGARTHAGRRSDHGHGADHRPRTRAGVLRPDARTLRVACLPTWTMGDQSLWRWHAARDSFAIPMATSSASIPGSSRRFASGDESLASVDIAGRTGDGGVDHEVNGHRGDVDRFNDAPDRRGCA